MKQKAKRCPEIKTQVARVFPKDGKVMPRNQKSKGINAKRGFPVSLDLQPGRVSASSPFSCDIVLSNFCWFVHAQSYLTLCDPMDCSPPGSSCPWNSPGKNTGVNCHAPVNYKLALTKSRRY